MSPYQKENIRSDFRIFPNHSESIFYGLGDPSRNVVFVHMQHHPDLELYICTMYILLYTFLLMSSGGVFVTPEFLRPSYIFLFNGDGISFAIIQHPLLEHAPPEEGKQPYGLSVKLHRETKHSISCYKNKFLNTRPFGIVAKLVLCQQLGIARLVYRSAKCRILTFPFSRLHTRW